MQQTLASNECNATKRIISGSGIVSQGRKSCGAMARYSQPRGIESLFSLSLSSSFS